jgi:hypothetical protein
MLAKEESLAIEAKKAEELAAAVKVADEEKLAKVARSAKESATKKTKVDPKTIMCIKGKQVRKVVGSNPKCPTGYKVK